MINPQLIRENPQKIKNIIASGRSNPQKANIDYWLELDKKRADLIIELEKINQQKNELAKNHNNNIQTDVREEGKILKTKHQELSQELSKIQTAWQEILDWVPNIPSKDMPVGKGEEDNIIFKSWIPKTGYVLEGVPSKIKENKINMPFASIHWDKADLKPMHHLDIGEKLGIIDNKQASKISGSRFTYLLGDLSLLQYGIQQLLFNKLLSLGFKQIIPPLLVKHQSLYGTSHFPEQKDQVYSIEQSNLEDKNSLYLVGSSEPANFSYFMDKTLKEEDLPIKLFAYTPCFRSEAGSWGKDIKGIKRLHQFDKIEMNVVSTPSESDKVFDMLLGINEWLLQKLELSYRLVLKCTGDAGYQATAKQVDPEVWLPGQKEFMEVMTDTNTTDFQARRLNIKFKSKDGKKSYVHTINDTGVAMGRILIAIIDNYQQSDGSIVVPKVLAKIINKEKIENFN